MIFGRPNPIVVVNVDVSNTKQKDMQKVLEDTYRSIKAEVGKHYYVVVVPGTENRIDVVK